jgi:hypothetical protein
MIDWLRLLFGCKRQHVIRLLINFGMLLLTLALCLGQVR